MSNRFFVAAVEGHLIESIIKMITKPFKRIRRGIDKLISIPFIRYLAKHTPIEEDKIMFITFRGEYDCNAKWIANEIIKRKLPYQLVWTKRKKVPLKQFPEELTLVNRQSINFYKQLASAKIIVDNGVSTAFLCYKKKPGQILVETWHGSLGIKKFSASSNKDKHWVRTAYREGVMTDYIISNSTFEDDVYREDFWKTTPIWQYGHARNDILCENSTSRIAELRKTIFERYKLEEDTKICMYAPTFRDDGDMRPYDIDYQALRNALSTRFGGNWVIFTRFHFRMLKKIGGYQYGEGVINASKYPDIYELITCVDVGITDYSSWICDYMLTKRPGFLFATDMAEYEKKDRDFFYPLDTMPFPLALDNEQLIENIINFDNDKFVIDCDEFLKDKGCIDDGHAAERIVDSFEKIMKGETP